MKRKNRYRRKESPESKPNVGLSVGLGVLGIVAVAVVGVTGFMVWGNHDDAPKRDPQQQSAAVTNATSARNRNTLSASQRVQDDTIIFDNQPGAYFELSNYYPRDLIIDGILYRSVEHYFNAQKFKGSGPARKAAFDNVVNATSPTKAHWIARAHDVVKIRNWDSEAPGLMARGLLFKFTQNPDLKNILLSTGNKTLVYRSALDKVWGDGGSRGGGQNQLGRALMLLREQLR